MVHVDLLGLCKKSLCILRLFESNELATSWHPAPEAVGVLNKAAAHLLLEVCSEVLDDQLILAVCELLASLIGLLAVALLVGPRLPLDDVLPCLSLLDGPRPTVLSCGFLLISRRSLPSLEL